MSEFEGLKKAVSLLWTDKAKIIGTKKVTKNHITNSVETTIVENEPCKVVLKGQSASTQTIFGTDEADAKLLIRNGIDIPAGAEIVITDQNGNQTRYKNSSRSYSGYFSHQELAMERSEKA